MEHYVYIYRDYNFKPKYVGYGKSSLRATVHEYKGHNKSLNEWLANNKYILEIAGPFDSEKTGKAVESAVISAINPKFNIQLGSREWRFCKVGESANLRLDNDSSLQHFVYIYLDEKRNSQYVGYGKSTSRANIHSCVSHNTDLQDWISNNKYSIEIAGPFGSETTGKAVESALISALNPKFNIQPGSSKWRFRPLGVPSDFADRLLMPALSKESLLSTLEESSYGSIIFVRISNQDFDDGRLGYDVANPSTNKEILERINKWWQIGKHIKTWQNSLENSPTLLLGITGRPGSQIVIRSVLVDSAGWKNPIKSGSLYEIPTNHTENLDAFNLRGRRVSRDAQIKFGAIQCHFFSILNRDGSIIGRHK